jgi:hypothetical protein
MSWARPTRISFFRALQVTRREKGAKTPFYLKIKSIQRMNDTVMFKRLDNHTVKTMAEKTKIHLTQTVKGSG